MRTNQQELGTERTDKAESGIRQHSGANENTEPCQVKMPDIFSAPSQPKRWVAHRKAEIVTAVRGGYLSLSEACLRYALSIEEYLTWQHGIDLFGLAGLRVDGPQHRRHGKTKTAG